MTTRRLVTALLPVLMLALAAGCGDKKAAQAPVQDPLVRPAVLAQSSELIRSNRGAEAEAQLGPWLEENPKSAFTAEGHYLMGQALFAQGRYEEAKRHHDRCLDETKDRTLKALAHLGRADCSFQLQDYHKASRQYHWLEEVYRDVTAVPPDEVLFKLGMSCKLAGFPETGDYWFKKVIELYGTSEYAEKARREHSWLSQDENGNPRYYSLEVASFSDEQKALAEAEVYRQKGYADVRVERRPIVGTDYYCIHVGNFVNRNDAIKAKEDAELAGLKTEIRPSWLLPPKAGQR
ncbi:MAG: SPOR domain-containing protein [Planctomycetota bacterium]|nr:SPOR domain-containing protein [Planctomycetota bacterium]